MLVIVFNSIVDSIDFRKDPDMPLMLTDPNGNNIVQFILSYVYMTQTCGFFLSNVLQQ